jgi:hypothetical protein
MTLEQMAQAHLANVDAEIRRLEQQRAQTDSEIQKLQEYIKNGLEILRQQTTIVNEEKADGSA